ncbi:MAG TPA: tripartite tricarboxylate transporter substrate binding protein [Thermodesulfobacteriota bacterium]|nr:tripartite tricarboxylate transporter substrate binding protein [Thermodesulfobacteriota bacterium]
MRKGRVIGLICAGAACLMIGAQAGAADSFPTKPLEIVVPYVPGGSTDVMVRTMTSRAAQYFNNQPVIVVNKAGGATIVGSRYVLDGKNDGYTLYSTSAASMMIAPVINKAPFSWRDFTGIAQTMMGADALYVPTDAPYNTLEKFIDYARRNPGKVKYTTSGVGGSSHLPMEGFAVAKGLSIKHIPTKGDAENIAALMGGHVAAGAGNPIAFQPHVASGKFRCLVQFGGERDKAFLPNIPTFKESGIDVAVDLWRWVVVPKGVAPERVLFLAEAFRKIFRDKEVLASLEKIQCPASYLPPEDYEKAMKASEASVLPLIKASKIMD